MVVTPNAFGSQDTLLRGFQGPFKAHMCHRQSVLELPKGAVPLAVTPKISVVPTVSCFSQLSSASVAGVPVKLSSP